jgi:hypothetical protein
MVTPPHAFPRRSSKRLLYGAQRYAPRQWSVKKNLVLFYYGEIAGMGGEVLLFRCFLLVITAWRGDNVIGYFGQAALARLRLLVYSIHPIGVNDFPRFYPIDRNKQCSRSVTRQRSLSERRHFLDFRPP